MSELTNNLQFGVSTQITVNPGLQEIEIPLNAHFPDTNYGVIVTTSLSPQYVAATVQNALNKVDKFALRIYSSYSSTIYGVVNWIAFKN